MLLQFKLLNGKIVCSGLLYKINLLLLLPQIHDRSTNIFLSGNCECNFILNNSIIHLYFNIIL